MLRNLFYSVFATKHSDEWRLNIEKLSQYIDVFNARKIVVIRSDESTHDPVEVEKAFSAFEGVEFIHRRNNPVLGEVEGFIEDFGKLYSLRDDEMTFYAHTKGVRVREEKDQSNPIRVWRNAMYWSCLNDVRYVESAMSAYACAGAFRKSEGCSKHRWHYAGNFWWVLHAPLFSAPSWREIQNDKFGVEAYLPDVFPRDRSFCTHYEGGYDLYSPSTLLGCGTCGVSERSAAVWADGHAGVCPQCGGYTDQVEQFSNKYRELRLLRKRVRRLRRTF
jgi:hypothetical protein